MCSSTSFITSRTSPCCQWPPARGLGLGLATWPAADLLVELLYGAMCWFVFGGGKGLLVAIIGLNLMDIPLMFPRSGTGARLAAHPLILPTVILVQIVLTWLAVWYFARRRSQELLTV